MNENSLTLESLPNELLSNIFGYINTIDLFQSFYDLNSRLNTLIQSLNSLQLTISKNTDAIDLHLFSPYVHSLIIHGNVEINLDHFIILRRLVLHDPSDKLLKQIHSNPFPYLEYLSIPDILFGMSPLYQKIFSNTFPSLKSCYLYGFETIETILPWTYAPSLRILKIGLIDFHVFKAILFACPNLSYFKLNIFQSYLKLSNMQEHVNLRTLKIHSEITDWRYNDQLIDSLLGCVSNLEQLSIVRTLSVTKLVELIPDYDWLASIITIRLPFLQYFNFSLHLEYHCPFIQFLSTDTRRQLRRLFSDAHANRYQTRFMIK